MKLNSLICNKNRNVAGLLSGTSIDGIDAVLVKVTDSGVKTKLKIIDFFTVKIPSHIKFSILKNSDSKTAKLDEICRLNVIIGNLFAETVKKLQLRNKNVRIDLIGSHGQTIHHLPLKNNFLSQNVKSTLQIGDPSVIANLTGITTVGDFRIADCAVGGDGAPLVPFLDYILFRSSKYNRALINIGGISNITVLPKSTKKNEIIAFDIGPGNMLIDSLMQKLYGKPYDRNGKVAQKGILNEKLFSFLLTDKYYRTKPPKSTGREHYGIEFINNIMKIARNIPKQDIIRTASEFTAYSIWFNYLKFIKPKVIIDELILSGGGANNPALMKYLKDRMKGVRIKKINSFGINADSKEAVLFALLANECISGNTANMKLVTGSKKDVILGKICPVP